MNLVERVLKTYNAYEETYSKINNAINSGMRYNQYLQTSESIQLDSNLTDIQAELDPFTFYAGAIPSTLKYIILHPYNNSKIIWDVVTGK